MTLEGAINFNETNDYIIYTMNSATTGQYGVVLPKNIGTTLNMLVDFRMKSAFDGVGNGTKTKEQLVQEIHNEYLKLKGQYADGMLVMPMFDENMFLAAVNNNDKQKMFDVEKAIAAITSELYKKLTESGVDKQKIDQKIIIVEKGQEDEKFVAWLKEQMPNPGFVEGVKIEEKQNVEVVNPFMASNDIFGTATAEVKQETVQPSTPASGGIFDNIAPVAQPMSVSATSEPLVTPQPSIDPIVTDVHNVPTGIVNNAVPGGNVDIFGTPLGVKDVENNSATTPVNNVSPVVEPTNVFGPAVAQPSVQPVVESSAPVQNPQAVVQPSVASAVEVPKPVESSPLDGTMTFSAVANPTETNVATNGEEENVIGHKSKGFANLLILVVILVGVTIASIELGKFLYNVYGA